MQKDFFPAFADGSGNVCSGVEISDTAQPNGCGCKPNDTTPCTYNPELQDKYDDRCFICTTKDLADGNCQTCVECLETCNPCIGEITSNSVSEYKNCWIYIRKYIKWHTLRACACNSFVLSGNSGLS